MRPREMMTPATNTFDKNKDNRLHQEHLIRPSALMTPEQTHFTQRGNRLHREHLIRPRALMTPETNTFYTTGIIDFIETT